MQARAAVSAAAPGHDPVPDASPENPVIPTTNTSIYWYYLPVALFMQGHLCKNRFW